MHRIHDAPLNCVHNYIPQYNSLQCTAYPFLLLEAAIFYEDQPAKPNQKMGAQK